MGKKLTFEKVMDYIDSFNQDYILLTTKDEFYSNTDIDRSFIKLRFICTKCGEETYKSYHSLHFTKNLSLCRNCAMRGRPYKIHKERRNNKRENFNHYEIYRLYCGFTKKSYIGVTGIGTDKRWGLNGIGYSKQPIIYNDIVKYGWDKFNKEILDVASTYEDSRILERLYIEKFNSLAPNGYNILDGQSDVVIMSKDIAKVDKDGNLIKWNVDEYTDYQIRLIRECAHNFINGKSCFAYGYYWVEISKYNDFIKDFDNIKNIGRGDGIHNPKTVGKFDESGNLIETFSSQREAARMTIGAKKTTLLTAINSGKEYLGFYWKYI